MSEYDPAGVLMLWFDSMTEYRHIFRTVVSRSGLEKPAVFMITTDNLYGGAKAYALVAMAETEVDIFEIKHAGQQVKRIQ